MTVPWTVPSAHTIPIPAIELSNPVSSLTIIVTSLILVTILMNVSKHFYDDVVRTLRERELEEQKANDEEGYRGS